MLPSIQHFYFHAVCQRFSNSSAPTANINTVHISLFTHVLQINIKFNKARHRHLMIAKPHVHSKCEMSYDGYIRITI